MATFTTSIVVNVGAEPGDPTGVQANRIADMMERFGVNVFPETQSNYTNEGSQGDYSTTSVQNAINFITGTSGLRMNLRAYYAATWTWTESWLQTVCTNCPGTQCTIAPANGAGSSEISTIVNMAVHSSNGQGNILYVEGSNEPNGNGQSNDNTLALQQQLYDGVQGTNVTPVLASIIIGAPYPEGYITQYMGADLSAFIAAGKVANLHYYPDMEMDQEDGSNRGGEFADLQVGLHSAYGSNMPILITEFHPNSGDSANQPHKFDDVYSAYLLPIFILDAFRLGFWGYFWFALLDYNSSTAPYGLFPSAGGQNPKAQANTLAAMYQLTGDTGGSKNSFTPGKLDYTITGLPANPTGLPTAGGNHLLFQNSQGTFFLFVWNAQSTISTATVPVTVAFNAHAPQSVKVYKITDSSSASAPTTMIASATNASSINLELDTSVLLLQIVY